MAIVPFIKRKRICDNAETTFIPVIDRKRCVPLTSTPSNALNATNIIAGNPVIGMPDIGSIHNLLTNNIESGNPLISSPILDERILITMNMATPSTAGFTIEFASGNFFFDFKEGAGKQAFTSNVELTNTYTTPGTYVGELSGPLELITKFIADNSKITQITDLKTGLLTDFKIHQNLFSGVLNMSLAPVSGILHVHLNSGLTDIIFANSGNGQLTDFVGNSCAFTSLDFSGVAVSGRFWAYSNSSLIGITFASSGNGQVTDFVIYSCDLTGTLDLSNVPISTKFNAYLNPNLTNVTFSSFGNGQVTDFGIRQCDLTGVLDLSNVPISTKFNAHLNPNLTNVTFASSGNAQITNFVIYSCDLTGTLDLSNVPVATRVWLYSNPNLTNVTFAGSGNGIVTNMWIYSCAIGYVDFTNILYSANNANWRIYSNGMSASEVNHNSVDIYSLVSGEGIGGDYTGRILWIHGTNAAPDSSSGGFDGTQAVIDLTAKGVAVTTS